MSEYDRISYKIVSGDRESEVMHGDDRVLAFKDMSAKAPARVLVILKEHVSSLEEVGKLEDGVANRTFEVAQKIDVADLGRAFRINNDRGAGQEVFHLHAHIIGGRRRGML